MFFDPIQIGIFILAFVPGYIFIQTLDHHLLKGEKTQFEKTVQILLASTVIWLLALVCPFLVPVQNEKAILLDIIKKSITEAQVNTDLKAALMDNAGKAATLFITVCIYSFVFANLWGILRRTFLLDRIVRCLTKRDWYKTVSLRFFSENMNAVIAVTKKDKKRYIGVLNGGPDDKNDNCIIIADPLSVGKKNGGYAFTRLAAKSLLLNVNEIEVIEVIKKPERRSSCLKKKNNKNRSLEKASKVPDQETHKEVEAT